MKKLIAKVTEYRDILSEGKLSYTELYVRRMDKPWYWKIFLRKGYLDLTK